AAAQVPGPLGSSIRRGGADRDGDNRPDRRRASGVGRRMSPRVTYWTGTWDPRKEGVSKEIAALRSGERHRAPVVAFSPGNRTALLPGERTLTLSSGWWLALRATAPLVERRGEITHVFGGQSSWHLV